MKSMGYVMCVTSFHIMFQLFSDTLCNCKKIRVWGASFCARVTIPPDMIYHRVEYSNNHISENVEWMNILERRREITIFIESFGLIR